MIGTGDVRVSPLDMALVASVVDSGRLARAVAGHGAGRSEFDAACRGEPTGADELRGLMRGGGEHRIEWVADVGGRVRTGGKRAVRVRSAAIDWFVGYQGNVAFAVVELAKSASESAAPLAGSFLRNLQTGS